MGGSARLAQYVLGVEGLALLRLWLTGDDQRVQVRLDEVRRFATEMDKPPLSVSIVGPELSTEQGYARWAATYIEPNPAIEQEERVVHALLDAAPVGHALDAACGTGRHAQYLAARGHAVVGMDASPEMLAQARAHMSTARFCLGQLQALPVEDASIDLAVCALALTHCADLEQPLREFWRVIRPGGRLIISDIHPFFVMMGGHALFRDAPYSLAFVRNITHLHSAYVSVFASVGWTIASCLEPLITEDEIFPPRLMPEARIALQDAFVGLPGTLIWDLRRL